MARVAVVGVGAIGGALASLLETAGQHEITLCTRRPIESLTAETPAGPVTVHAQNESDPKKVKAVDWVLVATKAYDAASAAEWFAELCADGAPVVIFQNGVEHRERFAQYVPADRLLPAVIDCPVERKSPERVQARGGALIKVEDSALGRIFAELFNGGSPKPDVKLELTSDFTTAMWWKLCINAPGALSALTMKPSGVLRGETMGGIALRMVEECAAVGRAEGARLAESLPDEVLAQYRRQPPDSVNSLFADRLAGRRTEWDARNGAIVRIGKKHGIETPLNAMAAALLEAVEREAV